MVGSLVAGMVEEYIRQYGRGNIVIFKEQLDRCVDLAAERFKAIGFVIPRKEEE